ncbi:flagellar protein FlaG [Bacillus sinesaloumensis]|uniref:flagellar protein FlaG n=1 Tax=Litchfieldia sinesaloumensis TaxID=1926280 RepID=UPI000988921B|nr:flagellar protein FlaG [Bacillus sinesaloumensis]
MSLDKISSNTATNFNTDYIQQKKTYVNVIKGDNVIIPQQIVNQNEKLDLKENVQQVINSLNEFLGSNNTSLKFELHDELNEYYVTIVNNETHEVVREIPSKKILDIYAAMTEFLGFVVDKKI